MSLYATIVSRRGISESQIYLFTHAESYLVGQSNHLEFSETAQTQTTHGQQGLVYSGEVNWDKVYNGS